MKMIFDDNCIEYWSRWKALNSKKFDDMIKQNENISIFIKTADDRRRNVINLSNLSSILTERNFWEKFVICLISSQSYSGSESLLQTLVEENNEILNPLSKFYLDKNNSEGDLCSSLEDCLTDPKVRQGRKGVRFVKKFSKCIASAWFILFKHEQIKYYLNEIYSVYSKICYKTEEDKRFNELLITAMLGLLPGIGLKQSRNILQYLGISQRVIPIDSRWCDLLEDDNFRPKEMDNNLRHIFNYIIDKNSRDRLWQNKRDYFVLEEFLLCVGQRLDMEPYLLDAFMFAGQELKN